MKSFLQNTRGNVAILFSFTLPVLLGAAAVTIDYGDALNERTRLQATADAASLAAVRVLEENEHRPSGVRKRQAETAAAEFVRATAPAASSTITVAADEGAATVQLSRTKETYFAGIIGQKSIAIAVTSEAMAADPVTPCILALEESEPAGLTLIGAAKISAPKCVVQSNSTGSDSIRTHGAAKIRAAKVCGAGGVERVNSSPAAERCSPARDPFEHQFESGSTRLLASLFTSACDFTDTVISKAKGIVTLKPGVYCRGLAIHSSEVRALPGLYVIRDGGLTLEGNATLSGAASILLTGADAKLDLQGGPVLNLTAMQTGPLAHVAITVLRPVRPVGSSLQGNPKITVTGSIYLPQQKLELQGNPSLDLLGSSDKLVALSFELQGSPEVSVRSDEVLMAGRTETIRLTK